MSSNNTINNTLFINVSSHSTSFEIIMLVQILSQNTPVIQLIANHSILLKQLAKHTNKGKLTFSST